MWLAAEASSGPTPYFLRDLPPSIALPVDNTTPKVVLLRELSELEESLKLERQRLTQVYDALRQQVR